MKTENPIMKTEAAKTTTRVSRNHRPARPEVNVCVPLVSAQRGKFVTLPEVTLEGLVATQLQSYRAFVKDIEGEEPTAGAVLSVGLEMLFAADAGFLRWQQEQRKTGRGHNPAAVPFERVGLQP